MTPVSVIVPTYQRIEQTVQTIELLLGSNVECIASDSTPEGSLQTALGHTFGERVGYTRPKVPGIATNKNQGARIARHPILIFCDSDMEVEPETIARTIASLSSHPMAAAVGGRVIWRGGPHDGKPDRPRPEDRMHRIGDTVYVEAIYSRYLAIYKDIFWSIGGYDETVFNMRGEGSDLSCRLWRAGYPLTYDERVVVRHVYDAPESAAIRVPHPEWGVGRDLLLLAYKYGMLRSSFPNFIATLRANFPHETQALEEFRAGDKPRYPFPFLEVFTDEALFTRCLAGAGELLQSARKRAFAV